MATDVMYFLLSFRVLSYTSVQNGSTEIHLKKASLKNLLTMTCERTNYKLGFLRLKWGAKIFTLGNSFFLKTQTLDDCVQLYGLLRETIK